jgi:hypothetical protein
MNYNSSVTASVLCLTAILVRSCPLWVDFVAKVAGILADRQKRAILESERPNF